MKHIVDWRVVVLAAMSLVAAEATAQVHGVATGQAQDAGDSKANAALVHVRLPGDPSAPPATATIEADFYGDADHADWYLTDLDDEPTSTSCFSYGHARLEVTLSGLTPTSGVSLVGIYDDGGGIDNDPATATPSSAVANYAGESCGTIRSAYIFVRRDEGAATPIPYTLNLSFRRDIIPAPPQVGAISPKSGAVGTAVTIAGKYLLRQVKFGDINASITSFSDTSITASVPPGAKTGPIVVFGSPSREVFTVTAAAPAALGTRDIRPGSPSAPATADCCWLVSNPALRGHLGRLVVAFPGGADGTKVALVKDGHEVQSGYGSQTWELLPGSYDVSVSGKTLGNASVQMQYDTHVLVGVLHVIASSQTHWEVRDRDGSAVIASGYGDQRIGLPVAWYSVSIAGQTGSFLIQDGRVTEF